MEQKIYTSVNDIVRQYDTILIIYSIISIVVLVCFFYLCSNVSKIRNLLEKQYYESHSSFDDKLTLLYELIEKKKRTSLGSSNKSKILYTLKELMNTQESALSAIEKYKQMFDNDIIEELKGLTSNYEGKKEYLYWFIEYGIVDNEHPHDLINE